MREFRGRQSFIEDNRKTVAVYNLFSSAEVDLVRCERNHYNLVFSQPIYFLFVRSKVTEPKQNSQPEAWMFYYLFSFAYKRVKLVRSCETWKKLLNVRARETHFA